MSQAVRCLDCTQPASEYKCSRRIQGHIPKICVEAWAGAASIISSTNSITSSKIHSAYLLSDLSMPPYRASEPAHLSPIHIHVCRLELRVVATVGWAICCTRFILLPLYFHPLISRPPSQFATQGAQVATRFPANALTHRRTLVSYITSNQIKTPAQLDAAVAYLATLGEDPLLETELKEKSGVGEGSLAGDRSRCAGE